jgi:hypothetical protein
MRCSTCCVYLCAAISRGLISAPRPAKTAFTVLIDPDNASFYNPSNMEKAIADFCRKTGQKVPKSRGVFLRSVYESLALKYRLVNEQIGAASGTATKVVHIVGGGSKNRMLNQFTADALGIPVQAGPEGIRFLLVSGKPLGEPVAWHGPIVMNTQDEIRQALSDLRQGTFIRS